MPEIQETIRLVLPIIGAYLFVLVILILVIKRLLLGDTVKAVERIGQAETEIRKREESMRREMDQHEKELAERRRRSDEEFESRHEESERKVARLKEQVLEEARREAADMLEKARRNEKRMRDQALHELEDRAVELAGRIFQLVFSERLNERLNRQFTDELLQAIGETDVGEITVEGDGLDIQSSHPLESDQKERLTTLLAEKFSVRTEIRETVRKELLAGLILKLGSLEIDGSLLSRYQEAVAELKKDVA